MTTFSQVKQRSDKGTYRKYATKEERDEARRLQNLATSRRYRERNRDCLRERSRKYRKANSLLCIQRTRKWQTDNPNRVRDSVYKRKYGINLSEYEQMVTTRSGCCDICKREKPLVIDHCHNTKTVRGLLCDRCNVAIGCFEDSIEALKSAIPYLVKQ